jgi:tRNA pseudouridine55 synthase
LTFEEYILNPSLNFATGEIILIDKPLKWTSFNAVSKIKYQIKNHDSFIKNELKIKPKVGHAGTLDPLATGLLIICTGKKTKEIETFQNQKKIYSGTFFLGATTPCFDLEKEIDKTFPTAHITGEQILYTAKKFIGKQEQVPPTFSAIWVNGKRAYELAREGVDIELKSRIIEIEDFIITKVEMPYVSFRIICSKGTYIRSIARDFGLSLNSGAHLVELRREAIGPFNVKEAITLN